MNNKIKLLSCLLTINAIPFAQTFATEKPKMNFIVILADDQGYNDIGKFGSSLIKTPNLDKMADDGVMFTNFYAQPICGPSRTALLTGCYPLRVAERNNIKQFHPNVLGTEITIAKLLKKAGYTTAVIGKWDINGHRNNFRKSPFPSQMGFDYWFGTASSNDGGIRSLYRNKTILKDHSVNVDNITKTYTNEAIKFIEKNKKNPFFLYLPHNMPHTRLGASENFKGKSAAGLYGDAVEELDWSTGEIINKIKELNLIDNTLIIYASDNGPWAARGTHAGCSYPLRGGKQSTWEGGVRVPCIFYSGKDIKKNLVENKVTTTMDLLPTIANLAGVNLPANYKFDGQDISSLFIKGAPQADLKQIYYYYLYTHLQAVREGDWKLVMPRPNAPKWVLHSSISVYRKHNVEAVKSLELYNLKNDMSERRNVANEYPQKVAHLLKLVKNAREDIGDYNKIGSGARFDDSAPKRPDIKKVQNYKIKIKPHPFYEDGGRW